MQTFLPFENFTACSRVLDRQRLGKQRSEAAQIIDIIVNCKMESRWWRHPAVVMWDHHVELLMLYFNVMSEEWVRRGYVHNMGYYSIPNRLIETPWWLGCEEFHSSHRGSLLSKDEVWYRQFGWTETPIYYYAWPSNDERNMYAIEYADPDLDWGDHFVHGRASRIQAYEPLSSFAQD